MKKKFVIVAGKSLVDKKGPLHRRKVSETVIGLEYYFGQWPMSEILCLLHQDQKMLIKVHSC